MRIGLRFDTKIVVIASQALVVFCVFLFAISQSSGSAYADETSGETSRAIAIAYDNSGSMAQDGSDKWCSAQYSLEVLAAMMGENDTLSLFAMDAPGEKLHLDGSMDASDRAKKMHDADLGVSGWTDPRAAREAYEWLVNQSADEKYLFITTDGDFNVDGGLDDVRQTVAGATSKNITVVYFAIGDEADQIPPDEANGLYVKSASGDNILTVVTEIANLISGRTSLDESMFASRGDTVEITLEVPMSKIIVFAQGEDVRIGDLTTAEGDSVSPQVAHVRYRDRMTDGPNKYGGDNPNTALQGVVATYDAKLPKGDVHVDISGAEQLEIYYEIDAKIDVSFTDDSGSSDPLNGNVLSAGTYSASYDFVDPDTDDVLESSLLENAKFSLRVENGSRTQTVEEGETFSLEPGTASFLAVAETVDGARISLRYDDVSIAPPATPLNVAIVSKPTEPVDVRALDETEPLVIQVTKENGEPLSQEEWDKTEVKVSAPGASEPEGVVGWFFGMPAGIDISPASQGSAPGTYEVRLSTHNGDPAQTLSGDVQLDVAAAYDTGNGVSSGSASDSISIVGLPFLDRLLNWLRMHLLQLIILLILLLLIAFIVMELRKPRLPNIKPRISGVKDDEDLPLVYAQKNKQHTIWPPWTPEKNSFKVSVKGQPATTFRLGERFPLGNKTIGIVAAKTKRGKKGFRLSDASLADLDKQKTGEWLSSNERYVNPSYSGERQVFTPGAGFNFQGLKPHRRKGWSKPEETTYRITF